MPTIRFLSRTIDAIKPPEGGRAEYWDKDTKGFGLRISESGRKSWIVMYRHQGRLRRLTMGVYPNLSLADARERAKDALRDAAKGKDPAGEKAAARKAETFKELAEEYMRIYAKPNKRSWRKDRQALDRDLLPKFGHRKAGQIKRREIIDQLDEIKRRGAPILANRTLEIIRRIYNWGIAREIVEHNPAAGIEKPSAETRRERVLTAEEIRQFWSACEKETPLMGALFKMRLITAQRGAEVSHMRRQDIDGDWWTIPAEFSKNDRSHRVPLSRQAKDLIESIKEEAKGSDWVFPSPNGRGPLKSIWKATAKIRENSGTTFVPHDLRRTAASRMTGDLGIARLTVSKILNHVETGVTSVYDRHSYDEEKRQALDSWATRLDEILTEKPAPSNVVEIAAAG